MSEQNDGRNEDKGLENLEKGVRFSSENQPSPEAKKRGWERKKIREMFMDKVVEYMMMSKDEFSEINPDNLNKGDKMAYRYVSRASEDDKMLIHFVDKHVPTPKELDVTSGGEKVDGWIFKMVDSIDAKDSGTNESISEDTTS